MAIRLETGVLDAMRRHAEQGYPQEVCGMLVGGFREADVHVVRARGAPNAVVGDRTSRFALHPRDLLAAENELAGTGAEIVGFYHSHPDVPAAPSEADAAQAWPLYAHAIVSVLAGTARHVSIWRRKGLTGALVEETILRG